jgi:hypothetical protein
MNKQLRYDFYQVVMPQDSCPTFEGILSQIFTLEGRERLYLVADHHIRLHNLSNGASYLLGDVARIRMNDIPDKMRLSGETEPLELDEDEGLGEVTSFIYHPVTRVIMMMRNRNAIGVAGLGRYVENLGRVEGIQFNHVLQVEAYRRLEQLTTIQRLDLEVAAPGNGTIFQDMGLSPEIATDLIGLSPHVRLSLSFSTGYDREVSLPRRAIERIVTLFRDRRTVADNETMSLIVSGREDNSKKEVIDLFEDVLTDFIDVNIRTQRRISDEQRHQATKDVWARHRNRLIQIFAPTVEA